MNDEMVAMYCDWKKALTGNNANTPVKPPKKTERAHHAELSINPDRSRHVGRR